MVSKFKSDDILLPFCPKDGRQLANPGILLIFDFFGQKGIKCYPIRFFETRFVSLSSMRIRQQNERGLKTVLLNPIEMSKLEVLMRTAKNKSILEKKHNTIGLAMLQRTI